MYLRCKLNMKSPYTVFNNSKIYFLFFSISRAGEQQQLLLYSERVVAAVAVYITIMVCGKTFATLFGTGHARKYKRVYIIYIYT